MKKLQIAITAGLSLCLLAIHSASAAEMMSTNYSIQWDATDGGGGMMVSTNYVVLDSVAQSTPPGASSSAGYQLQAGFHSPPDSDADLVRNFMDNCTYDPNTNQYDSNGDGFGNLCDPDLDNSGAVNFADYVQMTSAFLSAPGDANWNADADLNGDNFVNFADLAIFPIFFLEPPGPSGIAP